MTSSDDEKDVLAAYDRHANCYITKPVNMDKFMEAIRSIEDFWMTIVHLPPLNSYSRPAGSVKKNVLPFPGSD